MPGCYYPQLRKLRVPSVISASLRTPCISVEATPLPHLRWAAFVTILPLPQWAASAALLLPLQSAAFEQTRWICYILTYRDPACASLYQQPDLPLAHIYRLATRFSIL